MAQLAGLRSDIDFRDAAHQVFAPDAFELFPRLTTKIKPAQIPGWH